MRITPELLMKNAHDAVEERCQLDDDILAAYLCGSVLEAEEAVLGGTADIDLVFIHNSPLEKREIVRLTSEVHLDILHQPKSTYEQARLLREQPWMGFTLYSARPMFDPEHFLDLVQATLRGLFDTPENTVARAAWMLERSRQTWVSFDNEQPPHGPQQVRDYLDALECAANAVACLTGPPLVERRLLLSYPARTEAVHQPGLYAGLLGLLGISEMSSEDISAWMPAWEEAYQAVSKQNGAPAALHPHRHGYYARAIQALLESDTPLAAVWPLLSTWTDMALQMPQGAPGLQDWQQTAESLKLTGESFEQRLAGLDAYLDGIEEMFDGLRQDWGI